MNSLLRSLHATAVGFLTGVMSYSLLHTLVQVALLRPRAASLSDWLQGVLLMLVSSISWSLMGGAIYLLPQALLLVICHVFYFSNPVTRSISQSSAMLAMFLMLLLPIYMLGFIGSWVDAIILSVSIALGLKVTSVVLRRPLRHQ
jgi:hypothetical protein